LDHEAAGLIPTSAWKKRRTGISWQRGETLSVAIGQGYNLVTPLQMVVLTSAVANGGIRYKPLILKEIKTAEGDGIDVSGKTGTVQLVKRKDDADESETDIPDHLKAHAWFVSYAPSVDPKIAVAVMVEHGEHGSSAAAPIARDIIKTYLKKDE